MSKLQIVINIVFVSLAAIQASTHKVRNLNTNGESFLVEQKNDIKLDKIYRDRRDANGYTMFRVTGKRMEVGDFYSLCQSFHTLTDLSELVSIITIRNLNIYDFYGEDYYFEELTNAILGYVNKNEDYVMLGSLGVTVDYIKKEQIALYDMENAIFEQIYSSHKKMDKLVMKYFYEICFDAIRDIFIRSIIDPLFTFVNNCISNEPTESYKERYCAHMAGIFIQNLEEICTNNNCFEYMTLKYLGESSAFYCVYVNVCHYETTHKIDHFKNNFDVAYKFYRYLVSNRYGELFRQGICYLIERYYFIVRKKDNREFLSEILFKIIDDLYNYINDNDVDMDENGYSKYGIDRFCEDEVLFAKMNVYFAIITSSKIEVDHRLIFQPEIDIMRSELVLENVTKIIYNGPINSNNIRFLLNALHETKVFSNSFKFQYIYLDDSKMLSESEATEFATICNTYTLDACDELQTLELIAMAKPASKISRSASFKKLVYKKLVSLTSGNGSIECADLLPAQNKQIIALDSCIDLFGEKIEDNISRLICLCLAKNKSMIVDIHEISISNELSASLIYMLRHEVIETAEVKVSLVYVVPVANISENGGHCVQAKRLVRVLDNVQLLFLDNLSFQLRRVQLLRDVSFTIPNLFALRNFDLIYKGITFSSGGPYKTKIDINLLLSKPYFKQNSYSCRCCLTFDQIMKFEDNRTHGSAGITKLTEILGLQEHELNQILLKFMSFFANGNTVVNKPCLRYKHSAPRKIELFVTDNYEKFSILNLCELQNHHYYQNITYDPFMLSQMLKTTNVESAHKIVTESLKSRSLFVTLVSNDICKRIKDLVQNKIWVNTWPEKDACLKLVNEHIANIFKSCLHESNACDIENSESSSTRKRDITSLQQSITRSDIEQLADEVDNLLGETTKKMKIKVVSIRIKRLKNGCDQEILGEMIYNSEEHFKDVKL